jgi:hypothetical protein
MLDGESVASMRERKPSLVLISGDVIDRSSAAVQLARDLSVSSAEDDEGKLRPATPRVGAAWSGPPS